MFSVEFDSLLLLLKASSKQQVGDLCKDAFLCQHHQPKHLIVQTAENLSVDQQSSLKLLISLGSLIKLSIFHNCTTVESVIALFPSDFHKNLKELLSKIIIEKLPDWRTDVMNDLVSLPKLKDFNWRVDVKMASSDVARISVPTCILQLVVEERKSSHGEDSIFSENVELSKETLDTMLHGLGRIRDQLSAVARK